MMKRIAVGGLVALGVALPALAHVGIAPRESKPGARESYTRGPAPVTKLTTTPAAAGTATQGSGAGAAIAQWLGAYDQAFNAKDLEKLATFYHPDVTIYEGGGINRGWADYRDHHLGPELKEFENLTFAHANVRATVLDGGKAAYVTSEYSLKARMGAREIDSGGLETLVLVQDAAGAWKIRHSHTSARRRAAAAGGAQR